LAGLEPATSGTGNRCAIHCATRALGRSEGVEPSTAESQTTVLPLHHDRHGEPLRRRRDSNPQPRATRRLVSTELHYRSATPPDMLCEWRIGESNPWPPACKAGALPIELIPQVVVREGIEPPASAISERRSGPTELPDTGTSCGTRTRFSALKGRETNPYPNEAWCR
jgi:hypothetical protein